MSTDSQNPSAPAWLADLNPQQRAAVVHRDGPLLVVAGAGSGKTKTLAYRVAYLIQAGVDPGRILLLTFTRRAAEEMLKRAAAVIAQGPAITGRVWGGTFHAMANRLLRVYAAAAGIPADFTVMDQSDAEDLMNVIRHDHDLASREKRFPGKGTCLAIYSRCVNGAEDLDTVLKRHFPWCADWREELKALFRDYAARKQDRNVMDYDDLLLYWLQMLADDALAARIEARFDHILVDEFQDTNTVQAAALFGMRRTNRNLMVVGDDAQSIYSFRAATVRNMLDFPARMPGTTIVTLEQNYRSTPAILEATNRVIALSSQRYTKDLWSKRTDGRRPLLVTCKDEAAQDTYVATRVLEHREQGIPLRRQAVLFRAAHLSDSLELELSRRGIPYHKYGGLKFLEASHVKDVVSILRVVENPRDEIAWFRVLQLLDGVGPATAGKAVAHVAASGHDPRAIASFDAPAGVKPHIEALGRLLADLLAADKRQPAIQVNRLKTFYDPILEKRYDNPVVRRRDVEHLEQVASGYRSLRQFLTDLTLDPPTSTGDLAGPPLKDEDWLVLSTIHSAKGCEWDAVYLIHASDGCLPSDMATGSQEEIEEELRLAYVAMTRARDFLYVTWPLRYYHKWHAFTDRHSYAQVSRFLSPAPVAAQFEAVAFQQAPDEDAPAGGNPAGDIHKRIRSMWD